MPKQESGNPQRRAAQKKAAERQHRHVEAFMLMRYRSDDRKTEEIIWNSRDGVTPFTIGMRDGSSGTHIDWRNDQYAPDHKPKIGERVFITMTPEMSVKAARENAEKLWEADRPDLSYSAKEMFESVDALAATLEQSMLEEVERGAPSVVEVTEELCRQYGWPVVHPVTRAAVEEKLAVLKAEVADLQVPVSDPEGEI